MLHFLLSFHITVSKQSEVKIDSGNLVKLQLSYRNLRITQFL